MEELASNEIQFLVACLASEESNVNELKTEFDARGVKEKRVQDILKRLISDGTIGITKYHNEEFHDYSKRESLDFVENWNNFVLAPLQIYLTDEGYKRWETDNWGITAKRARSLMFSNLGNSVRV
ncbi:hypothetical protein J8M21_24115 [Pseudoalteromonas luteoviolacea]|uniref:hypothetical protein n=1 Tax=Pseudoalteromonas luteoviolacea TaxID=43657 RepID=UPI001B3A41C7|nr:hypothetical protein [Pseudoalteromonas luteoviolacea]MBQ4880291.1 hypothetical protein [Pseudoalteromonas luteoviolacea]MBQ4909352.1 hypothetical protein [Pseudoalteromonas luteoviolacea]